MSRTALSHTVSGMKCTAVGARRLCWELSPREVIQKGSAIPRL